MRKRSFLLVGGACLAALSLTVGSALADPVPGQPPFRPLQGVGSDTTQLVMNGYGNGTTASNPDFPGIMVNGQLAVASWDASPGGPITTRDPAVTPACQSIARPNGSSAGVNALQGLNGYPSQCVDFARSSNNDSQSPTRAGANLTYIPFALDGLSYATRTQSQVPKSLTLDELRTIYRRNTTDPGGCFFQPLVPQAGSGTRAFWNTLVGPFGTCASDLNNTVQEHDGTVITNDQQLVPIGVGPWVSQSTNPDIQDRRGLAILRAINGESPFDLADFPGARPLFNVIRNANINTSPWNQVFVGGSSQICANPQVLEAFALSPHPNCGSTAIQTPPN